MYKKIKELIIKHFANMRPYIVMIDYIYTNDWIIIKKKITKQFWDEQTWTERFTKTDKKYKNIYTVKTTVGFR